MATVTPVRGGSKLTVVEEDDYGIISPPPKFDRTVSEEYILPMQKFHFIENYFTFAPRSTVSLELSLDGRNITLIGIDEEESFEEFKKAFGDLIHPVVRNSELATVIDRFLHKEVINHIAALMPRIIKRGLGWNLSKLQLNTEENALIYKEIEQCSVVLPQPGELREAMARIGDVRLKRAMLSMPDPLITPKEIEQAHQRMRIEKIQNSLMRFVVPELQPEKLKQALEELPEEYRDHFQELVNLIQKRIDVFSTLVDEYSATFTMEFVLGEELNKRILKELPIQWRLPKENVGRFHSLLEYQIIGAKATASDAVLGPSGDLVYLGRDEADNAEKLLVEFSEVRDYYLNDQMFPRLLPFTTMSLHPFPRVEKVRQAFRNYFPTEKLARGVSRDMIDYYILIKQTLSPEMRDQLGEKLEAAKTTREKLSVLQEFPLRPFHGSEAECDVFVHFLTLFVPQLNEMLMSDVPPDDDPYGLRDVTEEMHRYYTKVKAALSAPRLEELMERIEAEGSLAEKVEVLKEFPLPKSHFSPKDLKTMVSFLPLILGGIPEEPVEEEAPLEALIYAQLVMIENNARRGLDSTCMDSKVIAKFNQHGREICVGAIAPDPTETAEFLDQLNRTDEESDPDKGVLVDADDEWEDDLATMI
jgi:hypothetical protein